jgi:hypothetical protein
MIKGVIPREDKFLVFHKSRLLTASSHQAKEITIINVINKRKSK